MSSTLSTVLLQAAGGMDWMGMMPLVLMVVVMYFFFLRPQMKRQKEEGQFRDTVSKGMRVVTSSGIHGKILEVNEGYVVLESENSRLKIEKSAISKEMSAQYLVKEEKSAKPAADKQD
ncbi:preprotein translocase subunit YajC [bacterium]|nr:preprotein translocase subunit YajC [bacterium]